MATVVRENIGLLNDKLTVTVLKDDYLPAFEKKLKEYSKTANIPGFRKGMVPAGMIKKMYGNGIFNDEILKTVEKELYTWLNTEKPEIFAQPLPLETDMSRMDLNSPADYNFDFEIGLKPPFDIADLGMAPLTKSKVAVTDEMVSDEVARMQEKAAKMTDAATVDNDENSLTISLAEAGAEESEAGNEYTTLLKNFSAAAQAQLKGRKAGDAITTTLTEAFEGEELDNVLKALGLTKDDTEATAKSYKLEVIKIGLAQKRELNEEFFNEVFPGKGITTEDALRSELKKEIQTYWDAQSRNQLHDQLYHYLLDTTKMEFPEKFLTRWLETGGDKPKTPEQAQQEFPSFSNQLKWTLISDRLINENNLQVTDEDLRESMKKEVMQYFGQMNMGQDVSWLDSYIDRMMKDEKQMEATYRRLITEKVFSFAEQQTKPEEKVVTPDELMAMQHNHQH